MSPTKDRYHHGDLREELMRASLQLIDSEGLAAVSLRRVAREAGVSPGAPYHHFADRSALLAALSTRGFEILRDEIAAAKAQASGPRDALSKLAAGYVRFAVEQPAYFRLMFRPELSQPEKHPDAMVAGEAAFAVLAETVEEAVRAGDLPADQASALTVAWWSLAHGLAALTVDGQLGKRAGLMGTTPEELTCRITSMFAAFVDSAKAGD
ncbi:TetR/AcrR family transcriptional regulator [Nocardia sp. NPDC127526]|uniref:TetR/AcrR family transcriptional regulator n=1 Tax=Nocardia sp. NPDC127526 TaxID=3345393 RepID=UPI003633E71F